MTDSPASRTPFPARYVNLEAARQRFGSRVDRLGRHLWDSDVPADRVITAMDGMGKGEGWRLLERGLRGEPIREAPLAMRELLEAAAHVPAWVDWSTCDRGGALLMRAGALGGAVLGARSLVLGYASPGGNKPLVFSGRLKAQAARRLNETARFVQAVCRPAGMRPFAEGWQITLKVRLIHAQVRKMILSSGRWDAAAWGHPANQHDLAGTTLLFSAAIIDGLRKLGMHIPADDADAYIHLWRWVGRTIGVHSDVLPASEPEAMRLADLIELTMGEPDQDSRDLTRALFEAAFDGCDTKRKLREAERNVMFGRLVCRELIGDELADKLDVPRQPMRYAMPMMKRVITAASRFTRAVPFGERSAVAVGTHYWDRVVEIGLQGATYEFPLPKSLSSLAA
ncbi:MAG: DUF2236 domain-containing protein [Labilithrix sp.]|nr:DUF2236 domain-containing protein [Labilithrix sp.]